MLTMEPTSGVWETVAGFLRAHGADVYFTRTDVVSQVRKVHSKFAKTDRIDAHTLAAMPGAFPQRLIPAVAVEARIRTLRHLSAQRQRLVEDATRWKNRFLAKIESVWAPLLGRLSRDERFSQLARAFFQYFVHPRDVAHLGYDRFLTWCRKHAHGNTHKVRVAVGRKLAVRAYSLLKRYEAGQTHVAYLWRDPDGPSKNASPKKSRALSGPRSSPNKNKTEARSARSGQSEDSTQRTLNELPGGDHD